MQHRLGVVPTLNLNPKPLRGRHPVNHEFQVLGVDTIGVLHRNKVETPAFAEAATIWYDTGVYL